MFDPRDTTAETPGIRFKLGIPGVLILLFLAACLFSAHFTQDDAFISYRYARNLASGHGLRFNISETIPVEGFTNFLWILMLTPVFWLSIDPIIVSKFFGVMAGVGLIVYTGAGITKLTRSWTPAVWGCGLLAVNVALSNWSVSGMETTFFGLCVMAAVYHAGMILNRNAGAFGAVSWSVLAVLTRPDGVVPVAVITAVLAVDGVRRSRSRAQIRQYIMVICAFGLVYAGFKYWYFGSLIPNTFHAKVNLAWTDRLVSGFRYFGGWILSWGWPLVLWSSAGWYANRKNILYSLNLYLVLTIVLYIICVGGDFMPFHRFFIPVIAPLAVLAVTGFRTLLEITGTRYARHGLIIAGVVTVMFYLSPQLIAHGLNVRQFEPNDPFQETQHRDRRVAKWLTERFGDQTTLAIFNIGRIPYYTDFETIDTLGLTDPTIARLVRKRDFCSLAREILSRQPTIIIPQALMIEEFRPVNWQLIFRGNWKGERHIMDVGRIFSWINSDGATHCRGVRESFRASYAEHRVRIDGHPFVFHVRDSMVFEAMKSR